MGYWNDVFFPRAENYWNDLDVGNSLERGVERMGQFFTNSLPGAIFDLFGSTPFSSAENYIEPQGGLNPNIYISADSIQQNIGNGQHAAPAQETSPLQEMPPAQAMEQTATPHQSPEDWFHAARDNEVLQSLHQQTQFEQLNQAIIDGASLHAAEHRAGQDVTAGREQDLTALIVDPVGHYARQDQNALSDTAHAEQRYAEDMAYQRDLVAQSQDYWDMRAAMEREQEQHQTHNR